MTSLVTIHSSDTLTMKRWSHLLVLLPLLLAGCGDPAGPGEPWRSIQLDERLVHAYTDFGIDLLGELARQSPRENLFVSPTSAAFALAMVYNGASGETAAQMARMLGIEGMTLEEANRANQEWLASLTDTGRQVELSIANSLWIRQGFPVEPAFLERNQSFYRAEVRQLDFNSPSAVGTINAWVSQSTRGKIPTIIDGIDPLDMLFLINALYFKADWTHQFDKRRTQPAPFRLLDGSVKNVPMMSQEKKFPYFRGDGFSLVALPYANGRFSMVLALPDANSDLASFYGKLSPADLRSWIAGMNGEIKVSLPRFTIEWEKTLNETLSALGMEDAFVPGRADFSGINPQQTDLHISELKQKTFLRVDEEGTEAAAVTSARMSVTSAPLELRFDRPFFLAIRDNATETLLFLGQVVDPS
ncbi:MAG TPA: serpin family protein, partial [Longimicrobiaceae bacterium]|nr:serpin family protein [Longimicrobiaceae bacterium]